MVGEVVAYGPTSIWGGRPSFARIDSVGGVVAEIFRDPYSVGGGGSSRNFPGSIFCGVAEFFPLPAVPETRNSAFFPLTPVTDPKFVLLKHVLCFARIMCRLSARIHVDKLPELGGGHLPPLPPRPVRLWVC